MHAGVVITKDPVDTYVPLYVRDGQIATQFIMTTLEELGLLKMDFLGLRTLTVIKDAADLIREKNPNAYIFCTLGMMGCEGLFPLIEKAIILFGDEKQNIYGNPLEGKKVRTNVLWKRLKLSQSMRSGSIIERLVTEFQRRIYADKYELDSFDNPDNGMLMFKPSGTITYQYLSKNYIPSIFDMVSSVKTKDEFK